MKSTYLFFIVLKRTDELMTNGAFATKENALKYIENSMLNKKYVSIKRVELKEKKK